MGNGGKLPVMPLLCIRISSGVLRGLDSMGFEMYDRATVLPLCLDSLAVVFPFLYHQDPRTELSGPAAL